VHSSYRKLRRFVFGFYRPVEVALMTWFGLVQVSHSAVLSLATSVVPTPFKTILELFRPAFGVSPKTGDAEPVDRWNPG